MPLNLLDSFGKRGVSYGLLTTTVDVIDTEYLSKYFVISEFNTKFTAGRNSISVNGSAFLKDDSEILVECLDSAGNNLYVEMARTSDVAAQTYAYKESTSFVLSIHVFNDTADGIGKLILYGTLADNRSVKWIRNITVDKTLRNVSKVRFYQKPQLEVESVLVPVLSTDTSQTLITSKHFYGSIHGNAATPPKDTNLPGINLRNVDVDYRLVIDYPVITKTTDEVDSCNSQMVGSTLDLVIQKIQAPFSTDEIVPTQPSASFVISNIYNNNTIQVADPYFYVDSKNNSVITNIVSASFDFIYPFVNYNTSTGSYLTTTVGSQSVIVKQSYADITYRNIRTFSGYLARHKIYKKSLLSNSDFQIVSDEPLFINEILNDNLTQNKYYERIGIFYNDSHIERYWFTSSTNLSLEHSPDKYINSVFIKSPNHNSLDGTYYVMAKNDSVSNNRNAVYVPYNEAEFLATSGSSYDSNFMALKSNVQYIVQINAEILKDKSTTSASLDLYFTSSVSAASKEQNFDNKHGIKIGSIEATQYGSNTVVDNKIFFFTPSNDLYGTLVIVPRYCQTYLKNISFRVYGDDGFSPDVFSTRIPWAISVANESFEIKSELFDINHNLVYSDLKVLKSFDYSGSSLIPYIPGSGGGFIPGTGDFYVSGSLIVSESIAVQTGVVYLNSGSVYIPNMLPRTVLSSSRIVSVRGDAGHDGELAFAPVVDVTHDAQSLFVTTNTSTTRTNTSGLRTRHSIAVDYPYGGRKVFYTGGTKTTQYGSGSYS